MLRDLPGPAEGEFWDVESGRAAGMCAQPYPTRSPSTLLDSGVWQVRSRSWLRTQLAQREGFLQPFLDLPAFRRPQGCVHFIRYHQELVGGHCLPGQGP